MGPEREGQVPGGKCKERAVDSTGAFAGLRPPTRAPSSTSSLPHCGLLPRTRPWPQGLAGGKSDGLWLEPGSP